MRRTKYASLDTHSDKVLEVLEDQATRGQVVEMFEQQATTWGSRHSPRTFEGIHGIKVNQVGVPTFALTADVSEAHRQIPIAERDWHLLGCQEQVRGALWFLLLACGL